MTNPAGGTSLARLYLSRRMLVMLLLGFASGLPLALSAGTLQAWLTVSDIDVTTIGYFALVGLPYTFKFVWAPLMDRFEPPRIGRRRGWLVVTQVAIGGVCFTFASLDPVADTGLLAGLAVAMAFLSASQDIVFDAYRSDLLEPAERGAGAALSVLGYRLAMIVSGGLALILADTVLGWPDTFRLMGVLMIGLSLVSLMAPGLGSRPQPTAGAAREIGGFLAMVGAGLLVFGATRLLPLEGLEGSRFLSLAADTLSMLAASAAALWAARAAGFPSFVEPWDAFFSRRHALALLALIVLYKLGDAFAGSLSTTFLIRGAGFSPAEVGTVNKLLGLAATIVGALVGGAWLARRDLYHALMVFGLLQAVSNFGYWLIAVLPKSMPLMASAVFVENICGGMGTAAFVAFLMALTDARFSAAQYALLSALAAVGRIYVGPASGVMVAAFGWPVFFAFTVLTALPGLLLLYWLRHTVRALDPRAEPGATGAGGTGGEVAAADR
jgi:PAT family beta-lactamase induction signal transducer AmpG